MPFFPIVQVASNTMENIKKVLLFGAGMVAMPVVRLLGNRNDIQLYIASDQEAQTLKMIEQVDNHQEKVTFISFNYPKDLSSISSTLMNMDMVISLLPAAMHISIAKLAIEHKKNMVTASYVSDGMRSLDEAAKEAGIVIMNGKECLWMRHTNFMFYNIQS